MRKITLHWICWQPTPYNDFLFRSVSENLEVDLNVHFIRDVLMHHPWHSKMAQGFSHRFYECRLGIDWHLIRLAIQQPHAFFVVAGWNEPTVQLLLSLLCVYKKPFAVWTDTPNLRKRRPILKSIIRSVWLRWIFQHASHVMGTGDPAVTALKLMNCPSDKIANFPFFVDLDVFKPNESHQKIDCNRSLTFLSSGRLENDLKGHDLAIRALGIVLKMKRYSGVCVRYRIAGEGKDRKKLEALAYQLCLDKKIEFLGWLEPDMLPDFYRSGDVLIHSSPKHDPFPNAVLEAMACGIPVIGSDACGSVHDRVRHERNGLIHKAGDINDLVKLISFVLDRPKAVLQMGERARQTAELWHVSRAVRILAGLLR